MDIITLVLGLVIFFFGKNQEAEGAGMPLMIAGIFVGLFGAAWVIAVRTHWLPTW